MSALDKQVAGDHYKNFAIQPTAFIEANGLSFIAGNIVKYACRADRESKGGADGAKADLHKIIHYAELMLALRYGEGK